MSVEGSRGAGERRSGGAGERRKNILLSTQHYSALMTIDY